MLASWQKYKELTAGIVFLMFSVAYYYNATTIRILVRYFYNAQWLPRLLAITMIVLSLVQIIYGVKALNQHRARQSETGGEDGEAAAKSIRSGNIRILATIAVIAIYIAFLRQVGFLVMTMVYVFLQTLVLTPKEKRSILFIAVLSIVFSFAIHLMFVHGFQLMLPRGQFF